MIQNPIQDLSYNLNKLSKKLECAKRKKLQLEGNLNVEY